MITCFENVVEAQLYIMLEVQCATGSDPFLATKHLKWRKKEKKYIAW